MEDKMKDLDMDSLRKVSNKMLNDAVDKAKEEKSKELQVLDTRIVFSREFKIYGDVENPIFLAGDIAEAIEHVNVAKMMLLVDGNEKFTSKIYITSDQSEASEEVDDNVNSPMVISGRYRDMWFLTENGVLELLTKSRKLKAKQLKLTIEEILKDIRDKARTALNEGFQAFYNSEFGEIRVTVIDGKPYAVGIDVAKVLEYARPSQAVLDHCDDSVKRGVIDSLGRTQSMMMISEGDIYRLIIAAANQSLNPEIKIKAKGFEKWVFDEVLPDIRKNGYYMTDVKATEVIENPDAFAKELEERNEQLLLENKRLIEEKDHLELEAKKNAPRVLFAHTVEKASNGSELPGDLAKKITQAGYGPIGAKRIHRYFKDAGWMVKGEKRSDRGMPTLKAIEKGFFEIVESVSGGKKHRTPYITVLGQEYFLEEFRKMHLDDLEDAQSDID
jgi:anti-repressor protein